MNVGSTDGGSSERYGAGGGYNYTGSQGITAGQSSGVNMGVGQSAGTSTSSSSSSSNQRVWEPQQQYLKDLYTQSQDMYGDQQGALANEGQYAGDYIRNVQGGAMPAWQQQLQGGTFSETGAGADYMNRLRGVAEGQGTNQYLGDLKAAMAADAQHAQQQMMAGADARAAASGMSGGARHGVMMGRGMDDINRNLLSNQANIGFQAAEAEKARQMQANQMLGTAYGQNQQAQQFGLGNAGAMANLGLTGFDPINAQWSGLNNYAGIVGGPTTLTSSKSSSKSTSKNNANNFNFGANQATNLGFNNAFGGGETWNRSIGETDGGGGFTFGIGQIKK